MLYLHTLGVDIEMFTEEPDQTKKKSGIKMYNHIYILHRDITFIFL